MRLALLSCAALLAGCALTSKSVPIDIRWFSPEPAGIHAAPPAPAARREHAAPVRVAIGRMTSSSNLRNRIVFRASAFELGEYEDARWTEYPEAYVRRSLARELFEQRPLVQAVGGPTPALDVDLVGFEEVRRGRERSGRVQLAYRLRDDREVLASGVVTVERRAEGDGMAAVVAAIASALQEATSKIAADVETRLATSKEQASRER